MNDRFEERRAENASGKRISAAQYEITAKEKQSTYADVFEEFTWFPLASYVSKAGGSLLEWDTTEKQIIFVTDICKQEVVYQSGKPGVNVLDYEDGRLKVKRGVITSAEKEQDWVSRMTYRHTVKRKKTKEFDQQTTNYMFLKILNFKTWPQNS